MEITRTVAGRSFAFSPAEIEQVMADDLPDPVREHYVVITGRRFPPKQVLARVTGLDRADFTTHQARRILQRAGFVVGRRARGDAPVESRRPDWPHGGREADLLRPYRGRWVAQRDLEVLVAADDPRDVVRWLHRHDVRGAHVYRVPAGQVETDLIGPR